MSFFTHQWPNVDNIGRVPNSTKYRDRFSVGCERVRLGKTGSATERTALVADVVVVVVNGRVRVVAGVGSAVVELGATASRDGDGGCADGRL